MSPPNTISKPSSSLASQQATIASMSTLEKLDTIPGLLTVAATGFAAFLSGPFKSRESRPKSYYRYVVLSAMRTLTSRMNVKQQHYLSPPTDVVYADFCKKHKLTPRSEILEDGTGAHWIGEPGAEKLIINFHGGGFTLPPSPGMFEFLHLLILKLNQQGKSVSCLMLAYDLAPTDPYPRQLQQAAALLQHTIQTLSYAPSSILISGDSAGANLAVALLSHIVHPHPSTSVPIPKIELKEPLAGAVLTSPWISFDVTTPSFERNMTKDIVTIKAGTTWSSTYLRTPWPHTGSLDPYNEPGGSHVLPSWFATFPSAVDEILIVCGGDEVLIDGIVAFKEKVKEGMGEERVKFVVGEGEYHDMPSLDLGIGFKEEEEGVQAKEIKRWIASKL